jgi:hypothetical protein
MASYASPLPQTSYSVEGSDQCLHSFSSEKENLDQTSFHPHSDMEVPSSPNNFHPPLQYSSSGNFENLKYLYDLERCHGMDSSQNEGKSKKKFFLT